MQGRAGQPWAKGPRILVAGPPATFELVASVLRVAAELLFAHTTEQALRYVRQGVCLIVCSERFDESRMFNFLHALQTSPAARAVPVVCCREAETPLSSGAHQSIAVALEALGVRHFLDMPRLRAEYGPEVADEILKALLLERLRAGYEAAYKRQG